VFWDPTVSASVSVSLPRQLATYEPLPSDVIPDISLKLLIHYACVLPALHEEKILLVADFLPREARTCYENAVCPSVCLSVCNVGGLRSHTDTVK